MASSPSTAKRGSMRWVVLPPPPRSVRATSLSPHRSLHLTVCLSFPSSRLGAGAVLLPHLHESMPDASSGGQCTGRLQAGEAPAGR